MPYSGADRTSSVADRRAQPVCTGRWAGPGSSRRRRCLTGWNPVGRGRFWSRPARKPSPAGEELLGGGLAAGGSAACRPKVGGTEAVVDLSRLGCGVSLTLGERLKNCPTVCWCQCVQWPCPYGGSAPWARATHVALLLGARREGPHGWEPVVERVSARGSRRERRP